MHGGLVKGSEAVGVAAGREQVMHGQRPGEQIGRGRYGPVSTAGEELLGAGVRLGRLDHPRPLLQPVAGGLEVDQRGAAVVHDHVARFDVAVDLVPVVDLGDADQDHPGSGGRAFPGPLRLADQLVEGDALVELAGHPAEVRLGATAPEHPLLRRPGLLLAQPGPAVDGRSAGQNLDHHEAVAG
jgi:hypothetical protein